jgi:hypothetical protein
MEINYKNWKVQYKPIFNPLKEKIDKPTDEDYQIHWHTVEENDLIKDHIGSSQVWTVVESKRDSIILKSGFHRENRMYHYITQIPYIENVEIVLFEGYPEITQEDLKYAKNARDYFEKNETHGKEVTNSLTKIIEYIERTGV